MVIESFVRRQETPQDSLTTEQHRIVDNSILKPAMMRPVLSENKGAEVA